MRKIGIDWKIVALDSTIMPAKLSGQDFDIWTVTVPYLSAGELMNFYFDSAQIPVPNRMNYKDAQTDESIRFGRTALNDADRAKAEIALEMGSLQLNEKQIRLYPDRNVLFAGTMNEDESTQSLSDKVLDRACVMRFGRPRDLTLVQKVAKVRPPANLVGLTYKQWEKWCESKLEDEELEKLELWIRRLNDIMEKLNRPFGHRVGQAIARYVANYPRASGMTGEDRLKLAMADQIEQRILPKLRGIDLEEHAARIAEIQNLIIELEDKALADAFEASKSKESKTFIWRGVDRTNQ
jgi:hypothetical protein